MPVKRKLKTKKRSGSRDEVGAPGGQILVAILGVILLASLAAVACFLYIERQPAPASSHSDVMQYENMLQKAQSLVNRYRNITGVHLPAGVESENLFLGAAKMTTSVLHAGGGDQRQSTHATATSLSDSKRSAPSNSNKNYFPNFAKSASPPPPPSLSSSSSSSSSSSITLHSNGKKDLLLGIAKDIDPKNFVVFCASFRAVAPAADMVIFIDAPVKQLNKEIASKYKATLVEFDIKNLDHSMSKFHPSTIRWPMFEKFLSNANVRSMYGRVWMADVRDAYFQKNPFEMLPAGQRGFLAFNGVESITIGNCGWNGGWVKDCFGSTVFNAIQSKRIICSGVSMGDSESVYVYLQAMTAIIFNDKSGSRLGVVQHSKFPTCERNGVDQGAHNALLHYEPNSIPYLRIMGQTDGPVANLQARLATIRNGRVMNKKGEEVAVVHQYDREPSLQRTYFGQHVYWTNTDDPMEEWKSNPLCAQYQYGVDVEWFKAMCDLKMRGGAASPATCCDWCSAEPACKGFTFLSGICFMKSCSGPRKKVPLKGALSAALAG